MTTEEYSYRAEDEPLWLSVAAIGYAFCIAACAHQLIDALLDGLPLAEHLRQLIIGLDHLEGHSPIVKRPVEPPALWEQIGEDLKAQIWAAVDAKHYGPDGYDTALTFRPRDLSEVE